MKRSFVAAVLLFAFAAAHKTSFTKKIFYEASENSINQFFISSVIFLSAAHETLCAKLMWGEKRAADPESTVSCGFRERDILQAFTLLTLSAEK